MRSDAPDRWLDSFAQGREVTVEQAAAPANPQAHQPQGVAAVIAAAGFSRRMGRFKPLLPWGKGTVIESAADALVGGGAAPLLVVVGHRGADIADRFSDKKACVVFNPDFAANEMLRSYQVGIETLLDGHPPVHGALLALGDQPHIPACVIRHIISSARGAPDAVVIPSHNRRRGHPIYLPRRLFPKLISLEEGQTLRDLLNQHIEEIVYVDVDSDSVRRDMDVPAEYEALRAEFEQTN
jgi:CTP:molybdopterin cytidylyltransferase MocA